MLLPFVLVLFLFHSHTSANLLPRQTGTTSLFSNSSLTSLSATITNSPQPSSSNISPTSKNTSSQKNGNCCVVMANFVALDIWYNSSLEVTVATVITQYIQYNNTVLTSLLTVKNNASTTSGAWKTGTYGLQPTQLVISGVPTNLVASDILGYAATVIGYDTAISQDGTTVASPTPVAILKTLYAFSGISTSSVSAPSSSCSVPGRNIVSMFNGAKGSGSGDGLTYTSISLPKDTAIVWIPPVDFNPAYNWSRVLSGENGALPLPGNVVDQMGHMPGVVSQVPDVAECSPGYLFGAPTAKIVVSELTDSSTTTIYKGGAYSETTTPYQSNPGTTTEIPTAPKTSSPQESPNPPSPSYTSPNTPSVTTPIGNTAPGGSSAPGIITIGTVPITQQPSSVYVISSKTLSPGGSPIEVSGTTYSLAPSATAIIVNGVTSNIPQASPFPAYPAVTTAIAGFVGPSQTLVAGGQSIVVSGTTYSLVSSGNAIVVNGHTSTLSSGAQVIAIGSQTFTYNPSASSVLVINGQTLVPGGSAITVSGETISLPASGTNVVVVSAGKTTSKGLGGYIISGLAGPGTQTRAPAAFTGSAVRGLSMPWIWSMIWAAGLSGLFWPLFDA